MNAPQPQDDQTVISATANLPADVETEPVKKQTKKYLARGDGDESLSITSQSGHTSSSLLSDLFKNKYNRQKVAMESAAEHTALDVETGAVQSNVIHHGQVVLDQDGRKVSLPGAYRVSGVGSTNRKGWDDESTARTTASSQDGSVFVIPLASLVMDDKRTKKTNEAKVVGTSQSNMDPNRAGGGEATRVKSKCCRRGCAVFVCLLLFLALAGIFFAGPKIDFLSKSLAASANDESPSDDPVGGGGRDPSGGDGEEGGSQTGNQGGDNHGKGGGGGKNQGGRGGGGGGGGGGDVPSGTGGIFGAPGGNP